MVRLRSPAPVMFGGGNRRRNHPISYGSVPERPKGADCKSVVTDFGGPNPPAPTKQKARRDCVGLSVWWERGGPLGRRVVARTPRVLASKCALRIYVANRRVFNAPSTRSNRVGLSVWWERGGPLGRRVVARTQKLLFCKNC